MNEAEHQNQEDDERADFLDHLISESEPIVAIDMGANSCIGLHLMKSGTAEIVPNNFGERSTPTWLGIDKDGNYFVGEQAKHLRTFVYDIKSMLGRCYDDEDQCELRKRWSFSVIRGNDGQCMIEVHGREPMDITQVTAEILRGLKSNFERRFNRSL